MAKDLSNYRKSYEKQELLENNCPENPLELFQKWFLNADASETIEETNAVSLSSVGKDGYPKSRIVLLKKYSQEGFIFYTNYNSEKGKAIQENNQVCLSFFWPALEQQIIIKGKAEKLSENLSNVLLTDQIDQETTILNKLWIKNWIWIDCFSKLILSLISRVGGTFLFCGSNCLSTISLSCWLTFIFSIFFKSSLISKE